MPPEQMIFLTKSFKFLTSQISTHGGELRFPILRRMHSSEVNSKARFMESQAYYDIGYRCKIRYLSTKKLNSVSHKRQVKT